MFFLTSVLIPFFIQAQIKEIYWFIVDILEVFGFVIFCLIFVIKGVPGGCDPSGGCCGGIPGCPEGVPGLFLVLQTPASKTFNEKSFSQMVFLVKKMNGFVYFFVDEENCS